MWRNRGDWSSTRLHLVSKLPAAIPPQSRRDEMGREMNRYDVVVVGARCAGAATAMLLAELGHDVVMVDKARLPSDTLSTHGIARGGVVQLRGGDCSTRPASARRRSGRCSSTSRATR